MTCHEGIDLGDAGYCERQGKTISESMHQFGQAPDYFPNFLPVGVLEWGRTRAVVVSTIAPTGPGPLVPWR